MARFYLFLRGAAPASDFAATGKTSGAYRLAGSGRTVSATGVTDGPVLAGAERLQTVFVIEAADYAEAESIALTCPHCDRGAVEVRAVDLPPRP